MRLCIVLGVLFHANSLHYPLFVPWMGKDSTLTAFILPPTLLITALEGHFTFLKYSYPFFHGYSLLIQDYYSAWHFTIQERMGQPKSAWDFQLVSHLHTGQSQFCLALAVLLPHVPTESEIQTRPCDQFRWGLKLSPEFHFPDLHAATWSC